MARRAASRAATRGAACPRHVGSGHARVARFSPAKTRRVAQAIFMSCTYKRHANFISTNASNRGTRLLFLQSQLPPPLPAPTATRGAARRATIQRYSSRLVAQQACSGTKEGRARAHHPLRVHPPLRARGTLSAVADRVRLALGSTNLRAARGDGARK